MKNKNKLMIGCIAGGAVLAALLVAFFVLSKEYFGGSFSPKAVLSNTDVSALSVDEALDAMNQSKGFEIQVQAKDKNYDIDISDAVTREFDKNEVQQAKNSIGFGSYLFHREVVMSLKPQSVSVDKTALKSIIEKSLPASTKNTQNASFDKKLNLVKEVQGDNLDFDTFLTKVESDIAQGNELSYKLEDYYVKPTVTSDSDAIQKAVKKIEKYRKMNITFTFGDETEQIQGDEIIDHLKYKNGKVVLDSNKWIETFVSKLGKKYNTYGKNRKFKTTKAGTVTVKGGIPGWWINESETVKKVKALLNKQKSAKMEPVYRNVAVQHGKDDVGDTYVEISIKRQHLWFYKNGKLKMESDVVTGLPTKERMTVKGTHRIYGKAKDRYLGTIAVQGYRSHVDFWMPFNWDGQGCHDASWRNRFGGSIYKSRGSHGCVNLPRAKAAQLFDYVSIGTPVIVY